MTQCGKKQDNIDFELWWRGKEKSLSKEITKQLKKVRHRGSISYEDVIQESYLQAKKAFKGENSIKIQYVVLNALRVLAKGAHSESLADKVEDIPSLLQDPSSNQI